MGTADLYINPNNLKPRQVGPVPITGKQTNKNGPKEPTVGHLFIYLYLYNTADLERSKQERGEQNMNACVRIQGCYVLACIHN